MLIFPGHKVTNPSLRKLKAGAEAGTKAGTKEECCLLPYSSAHDRLAFLCNLEPPA